MDRGISRQRTTKRKANAQGLIEFALITPVLLLIIFGIIDFGWMVFNYAQLYNGVREAARYGSVGGYSTDPTTAQYTECTNIKNRIVDLAGFSGIKRVSGLTYPNITVVYDDGRPFDIDAWVTSNTQAPSMTAYCSSVKNNKKGDEGDAFSWASWHVGTEDTPSGARTDTTGLKNGDRIVIQVNVNVNFLTPLIRSFAKGGMNMKFWVGRSIFPGGIQLNPSS